MNTFSKIVIAGSLLATMAFAQQGDPFREERFKAKFGRYSQAEEARRKSIAANPRSEEKCANHACCRHPHAANKEVSFSQNQAFLDTWSKAKFGRGIRTADSPSAAKLAQASPANSQTAAQSCDRPTCCE
jgi:hypothetical protein